MRRISAVLFALALAWDFTRRGGDETFGFFSNWSMLLQFAYFQLPFRSRALAFFHTTAFLCAVCVPFSYLYMLLRDPHIELRRSEQWDLSYSTVIARTVFMHFGPLLLHAIDVTMHQSQIVASYQSKSRRLMVLWAFVSYAALSLVFELYTRGAGGIDEELGGEEGSRNIETDRSLVTLARSQIIVSLLSFGFALYLLTSLILRPAFVKPLRRASAKHHGLSS